MKQQFCSVTVMQREYMSDDEIIFSKFMVVEAETQDTARDKIREYWENQSSSYSTSYYPTKIEFFILV